MRRKARLATVMIFLLLASGCQVQTESYGMRAYTMSAKRLYPEALAIARQQDAGAYLAYVDVDFRMVGDDRPLKIRFTFETRAAPPSWCYVEFTDGKDPTLATSSHEYQYPHEMSIADRDWLLDSPQALDIAQQNGGREFLLRWKPEITALTLRRASLGQGTSGNPPVEWCVVYAGFMRQQRLTVCVDAVSGQITRKELTE